MDSSSRTNGSAAGPSSDALERLHGSLIPVSLAHARPTAPDPAVESTVVHDDPHEWYSFDDADGDTWMFDVTFLTSPWTCIFGKGCQGVLTGPAEELGQGCCSYGAHLIDAGDAKNLFDHARRLTKSQWQSRPSKPLELSKIVKRDGDTMITRLVDDACIFLNSPDFPGGGGCALHIGAVAAGERPLDWKPAVCWQLPLRLDDWVDDIGHRTWMLREWKRRDWSEGGDQFHWWCTEGPEAFVGSRPVYETLADEIVELIGSSIYERLVAHLADRPRVRFLPHPARRPKA